MTRSTAVTSSSACAPISVAQQPGRPVLVDDRVGQRGAQGPARAGRSVAHRARGRLGGHGTAWPGHQRDAAAARRDDQHARVDERPDRHDLDDADRLR
jgi:hypothetical protein